jgi:hypothetical protein
MTNSTPIMESKPERAARLAALRIHPDWFGTCLVYWRSHGCSLILGHEGQHRCIHPEGIGWEAGDDIPSEDDHLFGPDVDGSA